MFVLLVTSPINDKQFINVIGKGVRRKKRRQGESGDKGTVATLKSVLQNLSTFRATSLRAA
jgi:hypothetical protein